jgi:hypothetical protein
LAAFLLRLWRRRGEGRALARAWPFLATSLPLIGYLLLHSLHDRIQAHWPAPVYPAVAVCAAFAADDARGGWRLARIAVPWFGFATCAVAALYVALPLAGIPLRFDPALPVRGWSAFARDIDGLRRGADAGWVGTTSYGLAAELADEPAIAAPILQINERERWRALRQGAWADTVEPGLLVDLPRRMDFDSLRRCFARVQPMGVLDRGPPGVKPKRYAVVLVAEPRGDLVRDGCSAALSPGGRGGRAPAGAGPVSWGGSPGSGSPRPPDRGS